MSKNHKVQATVSKCPEWTGNDLLAKLSKFDYGIANPNGSNTLLTGKALTEDAYYKYYHHMSPVEFEKYGGGTCWDYVTYEAEYLKNHNIPYQLFFIVFYKDYDSRNNDFDTHTYLVANIDGKYVYIESSFKQYEGIEVSNDLKSIHKLVAQRMMAFRDANRGFTDLYEYTNCDPPIGCSCQEYMDYIDKNASLIYRHKSVDTLCLHRIIVQTIRRH